MNKEAVTNSKMFYVESASISVDADIVSLNMYNVQGDNIRLKLDLISANGLRIAIAALKNIPRLVLPKSENGDYQCHFLSIRYREDGILIFEKENGETPPMGKYVDIDDGLIVFNKGDALWMSVTTINAIWCDIVDRDYVSIVFRNKEILEDIKKRMDKDIFPFERFGKTNKLSYGYFHSVKEEI